MDRWLFFLADSVEMAINRATRRQTQSINQAQLGVNQNYIHYVHVRRQKFQRLSAVKHQ